MWHPGVLAKFINTADQLSGGRAAVNVVSGWLKDEFTGFGLPWLEHDERYVRTDEFIRALRGIWTQEDYFQHGRYYSIDGVSLKPGPVDVPGRAHPDVSLRRQLIGGTGDRRSRGGLVLLERSHARGLRR